MGILEGLRGWNEFHCPCCGRWQAHPEICASCVANGNHPPVPNGVDNGPETKGFTGIRWPDGRLAVLDRFATTATYMTRPKEVDSLAPTPEESFPDIVELRGIRQSLDRLVALQLYANKDIPLALVYEADPSGLIERAVLAIAEAKLAERPVGMTADDLVAQLRSAGVDPRTGAGGFVPGFEPEAWTKGEDPGDPYFYDGVRRLLGYLNQPFSDSSDLDKLAHDHGWNRENIREMLQGMGLED